MNQNTNDLNINIRDNKENLSDSNRAHMSKSDLAEEFISVKSLFY
jgi:hypothetical protein